MKNVYTNIGDKVKKISIWSSYIKKDIVTSKNNIDTDVLIVGGGATGLNTAYNLIGKGLKITLIERNLIGTGITSKSTAKITYLQQTLLSKIAKLNNLEKAKQYLNAQIEGMNLITKIISSNHIDCDLTKNDSYLFARNLKDKKKVVKEKELLEKLNVKLIETNKIPNIPSCIYAIKITDSYVFNPIKYLNEIKKICIKNNINIFEKAKLTEISYENNKYLCKCNGKNITTKYIVIASHYPHFLFPYIFPLKVTLKKSYICAQKVKNDLKYNAIDASNDNLSIRFYNEDKDIYQITSTASHNIAFKNNEIANFSKLNEYSANSNYMWSNIDIIPKDYLPFIGKIEDNFLIATGYNAWGFTNSTIAGKVISDIILRKDNPYINLFNPKRCGNIKRIIRYPIILYSNCYSYLHSKLIKKKYNDNLRFEKFNNIKIAIYTDKYGKEHIVYQKCPHMKCNLLFNEVEQTWDCPCHGSRFDIDGKGLNGPSNYNITFKD